MASHALSTGAPSRVPAFHSRFEPRRPISHGEVVAAIRKACTDYEISPSTFGRMAVGDSRLVTDLLNGREMRPDTEACVVAFIGGLPESAQQPQRRPAKPRVVLARKPIGITRSERDYHRAMARGSAKLLEAVLAALPREARHA